MTLHGKGYPAGIRVHAGSHLYRPGFLHLVTSHDLEALRNELQRGEAPLDFQAKLSRLSEGDLVHRYVAKHSADFVALLLAAQEGIFRKISTAEIDRILRVLAYVRKDDDAIPDYRSDGLIDDQQEVHAAVVELAPVLQAFKAWHLRHQVPAMSAKLSMESILGHRDPIPNPEIRGPKEGRIPKAEPNKQIQIEK